MDLEHAVNYIMDHIDLILNYFTNLMPLFAVASLLLIGPFAATAKIIEQGRSAVRSKRAQKMLFFGAPAMYLFLTSVLFMLFGYGKNINLIVPLLHFIIISVFIQSGKPNLFLPSVTKGIPEFDEQAQKSKEEWQEVKESQKELKEEFGEMIEENPVGGRVITGFTAIVTVVTAVFAIFFTLLPVLILLYCECMDRGIQMPFRVPLFTPLSDFIYNKFLAVKTVILELFNAESSVSLLHRFLRYLLMTCGAILLKRIESNLKKYLTHLLGGEEEEENGSQNEPVQRSGRSSVVYRADKHPRK